MTSLISTLDPTPAPELDRDLKILGIETSCDETAAAVVRLGRDGVGALLSNAVHSQIADHRPYGGVVPEIAARAHVEIIDHIVERACDEAGVALGELDGVAATAGPGLIGGLLAGVLTAKTIALVHDIPFVAINHLEAHALTVGLTDGVAPPYALLLVSGGHTQFVGVHEFGRYERIGTTVDDALGEAFDKTAKLLSLGFPGGPEVEAWAQRGAPDRFAFPRPMMGREAPHFSFAGLKTAVRQEAQKHVPLDDRVIADLCAGFQAAVVDCVMDRVSRGLQIFLAKSPSETPALVVAGGVAANAAIRAALTQMCDERGVGLHIPPPALCTDNGAMIAWAGAQHIARGHVSGLDAPALPRWPLDPDAVPAIGSGAKGAKA